jgi:hypothetical protein
MFAGRPKHSTCTARESTVFGVSASFTELAAPVGAPLLFVSTISRWHFACISNGVSVARSGREVARRHRRRVRWSDATEQNEVYVDYQDRPDLNVDLKTVQEFNDLPIKIVGGRRLSPRCRNGNPSAHRTDCSDK